MLSATENVKLSKDLSVAAFLHGCAVGAAGPHVASAGSCAFGSLRLAPLLGALLFASSLLLAAVDRAFGLGASLALALAVAAG